MRIRVRIPEVGTEVKRFPQECPYCGSKLLKLHQRCTKQIRDTIVSSVNVLRVRCLRCERTFRAYPEAVTSSQHSQRLKAIAVLMYVLGLSYGAVEDVLSALGVRLSKSTVFRDVQEAGFKARERIKQSKEAKVVGADTTHIKVKGKDVVVGIVVEADNGMVIDIEVLEDETSQTIKSWLIPILKEVKAEVIVTDDADSFKEVADSLEIHHQVCLRHIRENITEFVEKMRVSNIPPPPEGVKVSREGFIEDLERLDEIVRVLPEDGEDILEEMYFRYCKAPSPSKGKKASPWYKMRNRILHLWQNWRRIVCHRTILGVPQTNNVSERAIGWGIKERYRTTKGYKNPSCAVNVSYLIQWLIQGGGLMPIVAQ